MTYKIPKSHIDGLYADAPIDGKLYGRLNGDWAEIDIPEIKAKHRIEVTLTTETNTIPLQVTLTTLDQIDNVNIGNTQIQFEHCKLSKDGTALVLDQTFPIGTRIEITLYLDASIVVPFYIEEAPKDNGTYARYNGTWKLINSSYVDTSFNNFTDDGEYNILLTDNSINLIQPYVYVSKDITWNLVVKNGIQTATSNGNDYLCKYRRKIGSLDWYQVEGPGLDAPSKKFETVNLGTVGIVNSYVTPANGTLNLVMLCTATNQSIFLSNASRSAIETRINSSAANQYLGAFIKSNKGDTINYYYQMPSAGLTRFRFTYDNSEVPMRERFPIS